MQETLVRSPVQADLTCLETVKPIATITEPVLQSPGTTTTEALALESVFHNKRCHCKEKAAEHNEE